MNIQLLSLEGVLSFGFIILAVSAIEATPAKIIIFSLTLAACCAKYKLSPKKSAIWNPLGNSGQV